MEVHSEAITECIDSCVECEKVCKETVIHCLHHGGEHSAPKHIGTIKDCAATCRASADLMITNSPFHKEMCGLCHRTCTACAEECEKFEEEFMKECAKVCLECAKSCEEMAK